VEGLDAVEQHSRGVVDGRIDHAVLAEAAACGDEPRGGLELIGIDG
jgi:hypothetical protein